MKEYNPVFIVNTDIVKKNIHNMLKKAKSHNLLFRPHFKTHQSEFIGKIFKKAGVNKIAVSSMEMAEKFIFKGWKDVMLAFPFNINAIDDYNKLNSKADLSIVIESEEVAEFLSNNLASESNIYLKIDTGYNRTGISWDNSNNINNIVKIAEENELMQIKGFVVHSGHTYYQKGKAVLNIHNDSIEKLEKLRNVIDPDSKMIISLGDTPSVSLSENFKNIDEVRPGNFVYYDVMQYNIGSCSIDDIAVFLKVPVVAKNEERQEIVVHGGAVHLSKESLIYEGKEIFGIVSKISDYKMGGIFKNAFVEKLSQEHGIIRFDAEDFNKIKIGDYLGILPIHSCLTANLMLNNTLYK